jgi:hypothetical protein
MPGGDRTGPAGMGPMTGRAAGYCAGYGVPGYMNPTAAWGAGAGFGRGSWGRGGGRGRRNWFYATGMPGWARATRGLPAWGGVGWGYPAAAAPYGPSAQEQADMLKQQAEFLEQQLVGIRERLTALEAEASGA